MRQAGPLSSSFVLQFIIYAYLTSVYSPWMISVQYAKVIDISIQNCGFQSAHVITKCPPTLFPPGPYFLTYPPSRCESCIDRLFTLGPAPCPICNKVLRKLAFTPQTFEDLSVEKEVAIRKRIAKECVFYYYLNQTCLTTDQVQQTSGRFSGSKVVQ